MCNCSSNSCDCNDYRVSTGPQGNTGPQGPQGPAGPPGNRTYIYSNQSTTQITAFQGTGSFETLDSFTLPANTLSNNGDTIEVLIVFGIDTSLLTLRTWRFNFGSYSFTYLFPQILTPVSVGRLTAELRFTIKRISSSSQVVLSSLNLGVGGINSKQENATQNLASNNTLSIQASGPTASAGTLHLVNFSIEKIKYDV
jgi:hypothetical protein